MAQGGSGETPSDLLTRLRSVVEPPPAGVTPAAGPGDAAVLLLADPREPGLPLLFMRRTRLVRSHRGQVAFPGGGTEPGDGGPVGTALREAREEMGVEADAVEILGLLAPVMTATEARRLTPVVAVERRPLVPTVEPFEVAEWFRIRLADLLTAPVTSRRIHGAPGRAMVHFYEVGDRVIWGATAAIIHDLLARLGRTD